MLAVADLIGVYGADVDMDAVERAASCSKCRFKSITSTQIIYSGGSYEVMRTGGLANSR